MTKIDLVKQEKTRLNIKVNQKIASFGSIKINKPESSTFTQSKFNKTVK